MLVLVNIALHPSDDKFMTVKLENVKIKAMLLTFPEAGQVLRAAGQVAFWIHSAWSKQMTQF